MTCPICGGTTAQEFRPFCSRRCADIDLAKWLDGSYAVPVREMEEDAPPSDAEARPSSRGKTH